MEETHPSSCDTFVVLPPLTTHQGVIFGKNSDRPSGEVQELVYIEGKEFPSGSKVTVIIFWLLLKHRTLTICQKLFLMLKFCFSALTLTLIK